MYIERHFLKGVSSSHRDNLIDMIMPEKFMKVQDVLVNAYQLTDEQMKWFVGLLQAYEVLDSSGMIDKGLVHTGIGVEIESFENLRAVYAVQPELYYWWEGLVVPHKISDIEESPYNRVRFVGRDGSYNVDTLIQKGLAIASERKFQKLVPGKILKHENAGLFILIRYHSNEWWRLVQIHGKQAWMNGFSGSPTKAPDGWMDAETMLDLINESCEPMRACELEKHITGGYVLEITKNGVMKFRD